MSKRSAPAEEFLVLAKDGYTEVPVQVYYEYRRNVRVASGKNCVYLRIPKFCYPNERESYKVWCRDWVHEQWDSNPRFRVSFVRFDLAHIDRFSTHDATYGLKVAVEERKTATGKLNGATVNVTAPGEWSHSERSEAAYSIIHRLLGSHYSEQFYDRIRGLHGGRFSKAISSIKLRNMTSKWGSCSHTGRMTLSTRLLFAPKEVQDYVIIHELCHLDELNHSNRFWSLVEHFDPEYKEKEKWLKEWGHFCDVHLEHLVASGRP